MDQSRSQNLDQDVQAALDEEAVAKIPATLENDACELQPVDGRDLFHFAVFKDASRKRKDREPNIDLNPRELRKLKIDNGDAVNQKWREIQENRRAWNSTAHQWWPPQWEGLKTKVKPFDVFCNDDEVHYTWQNFPHYSEDAIRTEYRVGQWNDLRRRRKEPFVREARKINHAKGYRYKIRGWRPYFFPVLQKTNSPEPEDSKARDPKAKRPKPEKVIDNLKYKDDTKLMRSLFEDELGSEGRWHLGAKLGGGSFGTALRYDYIDKDNVIQRRIVVKRDHHHLYSNDMERALGAKLKDKSKYILNYLTPGTRAAQGQKGYTYTEYATHGDLSTFFKYSSAYQFVLPEEFCWYLLHCLAEASYVLENGEAPSPEGSGRDSLDPDSAEKWKPIFHFDLKPGNILLDSPATEPEYWWQRNYPVPVVADLGGAARYPNDLSKRPAYFECPSSGGSKKYKYPDTGENMLCHRHYVVGHGTPGYSPFEALYARDQKKANSKRREANVTQLPELQLMRIHTTIYQIGCTLYRGMTNTSWLFHMEQLWWNRHTNPANGKDGWIKDPREDYQPRHWQRFPGTAIRRPGENWDGSADKPYPPRCALLPHYSHKLVDLVFKCMHPLHDQRPSPKELWDETSKMMAEFDRIWPKPGSNNSAAASGDGRNDDDMDGLDVDYRSADDDDVDAEVLRQQRVVIDDPRTKIDKLYENIREQYVDVEPEQVPQIWRVRHEASSMIDPVVRQWRQEKDKRLERRRARRDKEYNETLKVLNDKKAYKAALDVYITTAIEKLKQSKKAGQNWDSFTDKEKKEREGELRYYFDDGWRKDGKHVFTNDDLRDFDEDAAPPEKPPTPLLGPRQYEEMKRSMNRESESTETAEPIGKLLRYGPRMVALPWDYEPAGATVMLTDRWKIPLKGPTGKPYEYGEFDEGKSGAVTPPDLYSQPLDSEDSDP
ncbi:kinase-like domain-containing protein [Phyllosticta citricarpa]|uniref:Kinase-like domain-containing protein n=2 Tax=Phyllosticta TaxID=121621 RepID=A0ABR1MD30_9PEZI